MSQRSWCFTLFDVAWSVKDAQQSEIKYLIYQKEKCPTSNREHYQGYCELLSKVGIKKFKSILNSESAHVESRKGTRDQARAYCQKEDTRIDGPFEYGVWEHSQGHRSDLDTLVTCVKEGLTDLQLLDKIPSTFARYYKTVDKIRSVLDKEKSRDFRKLKVYVYWGAPGTGKTRTVYTKGPVYNYNWRAKWWDGYEGEDILLIDDFNGNYDFELLLNILDGYQLRLEIKGSHTYARYTQVYLTSNFPPDKWYPFQENIAALYRRITEIIKF